MFRVLLHGLIQESKNESLQGRMALNAYHLMNGQFPSVYEKSMVIVIDKVIKIYLDFNLRLLNKNKDDSFNHFFCTL
jgi:hypothetical protein